MNWIFEHLSIIGAVAGLIGGFIGIQGNKSSTSKKFDKIYRYFSIGLLILCMLFQFGAISFDNYEKGSLSNRIEDIRHNVNANNLQLKSSKRQILFNIDEIKNSQFKIDSIIEPQIDIFNYQINKLQENENKKVEYSN